MWQVEYTDEFAEWWETLTLAEQASLEAAVRSLERFGPRLSRPYADTVKGSRHSNMKELRTQCKGRPLRTFFALDPRRSAILLIGGDKTGDDRFYERMLPLADKLYDKYLQELRDEGLI
jgi:hypothetical protein